MPNPAGFFLVARVGAGHLEYLRQEIAALSESGDRYFRAVWTRDDGQARQFIVRANAGAVAKRHDAGVVVRSFQAVPQAGPRQAARTARQRRAAAGPGLYLSVTRKVPAKNGQNGAR